MENETETMLSELPSAYISLSVSIGLGVPVHVYCIYFIIMVMKLNSYIKIIFVVLTTQFLMCYLSIIGSLIPILFFSESNSWTCIFLIMPMGVSGKYWCIKLIIPKKCLRKVAPRLPEVAPRLPQGCPEVAPRLPRGCHEVAPRLPRGCPEVTWGCPEISLRFPRIWNNKQQNFKKT